MICLQCNDREPRQGHNLCQQCADLLGPADQKYAEKLLQQCLTTAEGVITGLERSLEAVVRERDEAREQAKALLADLAASNEEIKSLRRNIREWAEYCYGVDRRREMMEEASK